MDGLGVLRWYVGVNQFSIKTTGIRLATKPYSGNAMVNNSITYFWNWYQDLFYEQGATGDGRVQHLPFYFYNKGENTDPATWRGNATSPDDHADQAKGRYLVVCERGMTKEQVLGCLFNFGFQVEEVDE
jgi:hypothetical protein